MTGMHTVKSGNIAEPLSLKLRIKNVNKREKFTKFANKIVLTSWKPDRRLSNT